MIICLIEKGEEQQNEVEEMKKKVAENKILTESLKEAKEEVEKLRKQVNTQAKRQYQGFEARESTTQGWLGSSSHKYVRSFQSEPNEQLDFQPHFLAIREGNTDCGW